MFAPHLGHLFFVGRDPDRSALFVLDIGGQFRPQRLPELLRIARQGKLRLGIVHGDDVPHPGSGCPAAHNLPLDDATRMPRRANSSAHAAPTMPAAHNHRVKV